MPLEDAQFSSEKQYCKCEEFGKSSTIVCNYHYDVDNCHAEQTQRTGTERTADLLTRSRSRRSAQLHDEDDDYFAADFEYDATFRGSVSMNVMFKGMLTLTAALRNWSE